VKRTFISINACEELLQDFYCGRVDFKLIVLEYAAQYRGSNPDSFASRHTGRWQLWWKSETEIRIEMRHWSFHFTHAGKRECERQ